MLCRNEERGAAAVLEVKQASGNQDVHLKVQHLTAWWGQVSVGAAPPAVKHSKALAAAEKVQERC
jgi:hypothetical protein